MKYFKLLLFSFLVLFIVTINVNAKEKIELVSATGSNSSKSFESFTYNGYGIIQENGVYYFKSSIVNNTKKYLPISINVLLFNDKKENIGLFSYCSKHDIEGTYSFKEIDPKGNIDFKYELSSKYLPDTKYKASDIVYIAIQNDNIDCKTGGYGNYIGKSFDEFNKDEEIEVVKNNKTVTVNGKDYDYSFINDTSFVFLAVVLVFCIFVYIIQGVIINALYIKLYRKSSALCYLPIGNAYMAGKVVFGDVFALIYFFIYLAGIGLSIIGINFVSGIANIVFGILFLMIIIKLLSKNYELFLLTPIDRGDIGSKKELVKKEEQKEEKKKDVKKNEESNEYGFNQHESDLNSMKSNVDSDSLQNDTSVNRTDEIEESEESDLKKFFK